jgi:hypothetical protein
MLLGLLFLVISDCFHLLQNFGVLILLLFQLFGGFLKVTFVGESADDYCRKILIFANRYSGWVEIKNKIYRWPRSLTLVMARAD